MTNLQFKRGNIAVLAFLLCACLSAAAATPEYRAFWADAFNTGFKNQTDVNTMLGVPGTTQAGRIRDANCNAVIIQVRKRFDVCYPSGVGEPYMSGLSPSDFNALAAIIKAAHDTTGGKQRVEVHCWSVAFKTGKGAVYSQHISPPTGSLTSFDNYWPTRMGSTNGAETADGALDPGHPKALEYLVNAHMDLANFQTTAGLDGTDGRIDGIHYDYIRFEDNTEGFNPTSVARYNARYGLTGEPSSTSEQFKQWRRDQVTAFVRQMYARIQRTNPRIKQSGAFVTWNPSPTSSTRAGFQNTRPYYDVYSDWDAWMQEGIMDIAVPMTYYNWASLPNDYTRWMNFQKDRKFNRHVIVGPGVYLNSLDNAILELLMTREASPAGNYAQGFSGYSYYAPYTSGSSYGTWPNFAPRLLADVTPERADIPDMPWKSAPTEGHLMGTVTFAADGRWADNTIVTITGPVTRSMYVDGTGFYAFVDLPPGSYALTTSLAGYAGAATNATIAAGSAITRDFALQLAGPPEISRDPQSQTVYAGAPVSFAASASGAEPLFYQWRKDFQALPDETNKIYSIAAATTNHHGQYDFIVTNQFGSATSGVATLNVIVPKASDRFTPLWKIAPGDRPYLTSGNDQRGMTYNAVTDRLLLVSRGAPAVYVLDAQTGADLHTLRTNGISGGYQAGYYLLMIGTADDGAIYACNLALNAASTPFKIYRWANDGKNTTPTIAYSGDPLPGNTQRWGDTMAVRGAGAATQIIVGSRSGTNAVVFTTADGLNFVARPISVTGARPGAFGLGIAFGTNNTFWGKAVTIPLTLNSFDLATGAGTVLGTNQLAGNIGPIGISSTASNLAGVSIETPDNLQLYDVMPGVGVSLVATNPFATDNDSAMYTGSVAFAPGRVYALCTGNGLLAMSYLPKPFPPVITTQPQSRSVPVSSDVLFSVAATGTEPISYEWRFKGAPIPAANAAQYTRQAVVNTDAGDYTVVLTNVAGAVTSDVAALTVEYSSPPLLTGVSPQSGQTVHLEFSGGPGQFVLQASPDLITWTNRAILDVTSATFTHDEPTTHPKLFYRVKRE